MISTAGQTWHALCDKLGQAGYDSLSPEEKAWVNLRGLIDSIENGGLISYFYNSYADHLPDCLVALRRLEASRVAAEVSRVCALFPGGVASDIDARNDVITSWGDSPQEGTIGALLEDVDNRLMPMMSDLESRLGRFLQQHGMAI